MTKILYDKVPVESWNEVQSGLFGCVFLLLVWKRPDDLCGFV